MKKCSRCKEFKVIEAFHKNKSRKDGRAWECKACKKEHNRKYRQENPEKIAERKHKYYKENFEKIAEQKRKYKQENFEKIAEYNRKYKQENFEKYTEYSRKYKQKNPEKIMELDREYNRKYRQELRPYYLNHLIRSQTGLPAADVPPEFLDIKKAQVLIHRFSLTTKN